MLKIDPLFKNWCFAFEILTELNVLKNY